MSKHTRIIYGLLVLATLLAAGETKAQSEETDFQTWTDFTFTYIIKNRTNLGVDFGVRGVVSKNDWNQFYFRPAYQYFFNKTLQAGGGIAIFATVSDLIDNTTEFRIFQEVSVAWPSLEWMRFYHRLRFEQRFFTYEQNPAFGVELTNDFEFRARYQLSFESVDIHLWKNNRPFYLVVGWELFYALNDVAVEQFINNQRILGGIGHRLTPSFKYDIQYILQKSRQFSDEGLKTTENLLRLRLFLLLRSKKDRQEK